MTRDSCAKYPTTTDAFSAAVNTLNPTSSVTHTQADRRGDGANEYHVTSVSPPEFGLCDIDGMPESVEILLIGLSRQANSVSETFYVAVASPEPQEFRRGEPPRHVRRLRTLGRLESCQETRTSGTRLS